MYTFTIPLLNVGACIANAMYVYILTLFTQTHPPFKLLFSIKMTQVILWINLYLNIFLNEYLFPKKLAISNLWFI